MIVWIKPDHLQRALKAPQLCRVEPTQRCADFVPLYLEPGNDGVALYSATAALTTAIEVGHKAIAERDYWKDQARILKADRYEHAVAMAQHEELVAERDALLKFAKSILDDWPEIGTYDGGDIQSLAVDTGLLIGKEVTKPCGEGCNCVEYYELTPAGEFPFETTCYRRVDFLKDKS